MKKSRKKAVKLLVKETVSGLIEKNGIAKPSKKTKSILKKISKKLITLITQLSDEVKAQEKKIAKKAAKKVKKSKSIKAPAASSQV